MNYQMKSLQLVATGKLEELQEQLTAAETAKVKQKEQKNYLDTC